jgi:hypothetical protein
VIKLDKVLACFVANQYPKIQPGTESGRERGREREREMG